MPEQRNGFIHDIRGNRSTTRLIPYLSLSLAFVAMIVGTVAETKWIASQFIDKILWFGAIVLGSGKAFEELSDVFSKIAKKIMRRKEDGDAGPGTQ